MVAALVTEARALLALLSAERRGWVAGGWGVVADLWPFVIKVRFKE